ncbi:N-lysine methyltransferase setd6-like [Protopterus annectens]|uniref:N-lysine methyltransferase setd6-like n=1 Tax=Protopterus annectens TaxID=7888 RepID=UPI001CF9B4EA|nr:N-lysine methyltransferase setd6-like [Protopterus annectens]
MAAEAKRLKLETDKSTDNLTNDSLIHFLNWCEKVGVVISPKVYVNKKGTVSDYGMLAREDIEEGEVLFTVPRSAVLYQNTTAIHSMLEKEKEILDSQSGWVPLLLSLLYEVTNSESHWKPYFSLWPDFCFLNHPMFWSEGERQRLLSGTSILEAVHKDIVNIQHEYNTIVLPFMKSHPEFFDPQKHTLELYQKLVAFVMAYSLDNNVDWMLVKIGAV